MRQLMHRRETNWPTHTHKKSFLRNVMTTNRRRTSQTAWACDQRRKREMGLSSILHHLEQFWIATTGGHLFFAHDKIQNKINAAAGAAAALWRWHWLGAELETSHQPPSPPPPPHGTTASASTETDAEMKKLPMRFAAMNASVYKH